MNQKSVNIVVVTWNALEYTKKCLDSIRAYTSYPHTITVIDNASTDTTLDYLRKEKDINLVVNKENVGYGGAIVQGFEAKTTPFVCVMNNDIVVSPGWLDSMVETMEANPRLGLLGTLRPAGFCVHPFADEDTREVLKETRGDVLPSPEEWLARFCNPYTYEEFVGQVTRVNNFGLRKVEGPPSFVSTCCALINSEVVREVGGLTDSRFYKYGCEDVDLCWRISTSDYGVAITSEVYIHHYKHVSVEVSNLDRKRLTETNNLVFYDKWEGEIKDYLRRKNAEGEDFYRLLTEESDEYWFLSRLERIVGSERFWHSIERSPLGKERK